MWIVFTNETPNKQSRKGWSHDFDVQLNEYVMYPGLSRDGRWFWMCSMKQGAIEIRKQLRKLNKGTTMQLFLEQATYKHDRMQEIGYTVNASEVKDSRRW